MSRELFKIIESVIGKKMMVRFSAHPGGHISLGIYNNVEQTEQYLYECQSLEELEREVIKEWSVPVVRVFPTMPTPPGFPKP